MVTRNEQIERVVRELLEIMPEIAFSDMELCELTTLLMVYRQVYDRIQRTGIRPAASGPWDDDDPETIRRQREDSKGVMGSNRESPL
ncbi:MULTISPECIES: hypothetical protein [unclassified Mycobacterium]|uniref:hypothetical protein n=1 Tax=unclassified Mycobacterium TaxID=2642494 RepID=UPI0029C86AB9|nr:MULTISPECIES: hypothetical protein [unclassified Mycobacterium]